MAAATVTEAAGDRFQLRDQSSSNYTGGLDFAHVLTRHVLYCTECSKLYGRPKSGIARRNLAQTTQINIRLQSPAAIRSGAILNSIPSTNKPSA